MARVRYINPGYFMDDELTELPPLTRILFAALWCIADREGRLKDRPKRIKAEALPYDDCDIDAMLQELHDAEFIYRYEADGERIIAIPKWKRYQNPHYREAESMLAPCLDQRWLNVESKTGHAWANVESTLRQRCVNVERSNSNSNRNSNSAETRRPVDNSTVRPPRSAKQQTCERCKAERFSDTPLTMTEAGTLHCPVCDWAPDSMTVGEPGTVQ